MILAALVGDPIASKYPDLARRVNDGCKRLAERADAAGVNRLVFTSTCSNYGLRDTDEPADRRVRALSGLAVRRAQGRLRAVRPGSLGLEPLPDPPSHRHRLRALSAHALRPHHLGVHPDARRRRRARRLRRRHMAALLPRRGHLRRRHDGARRRRGPGALRGLQRRPLGRELHEADGRGRGPGGPRTGPARSPSRRAGATRGTTASTSTRSASSSDSSRNTACPRRSPRS